LLGDENRRTGHRFEGGLHVERILDPLQGLRQNARDNHAACWAIYAQPMTSPPQGSHRESNCRFQWGELTRDDSPLPVSVKERLRWYESNARFQMKAFRTSEIAIISFSAAILLAVALGAAFNWKPDWRSTVAAALGALVVIASGLRHLYRWGENWIRSSQTFMAMQTEAVKWSQGLPPYDSSAANATLCEQAESIVSAETLHWASTLKESTPKRNEPSRRRLGT
jgi:hypothetical protein